MTMTSVIQTSFNETKRNLLSNFFSSNISLIKLQDLVVPKKIKITRLGILTCLISL